MNHIRILILLAAMSARLMAVPAFARQTGNDCTACHQLPTLQLTQVGLDFQRNGKRMEPAAMDAKTQDLPNYFSLMVEEGYNAAQSTKPSTSTDQPSFSMYSGGALSDRFSYTAIYHFNEQESPSANLEEAFIQYNLPVAKDAFIAFRGGQFNPELLRNFGVGPGTTGVDGQVIPGMGLDGAMHGLDAKLNWGSFEFGMGLFDPLATGPDDSHVNQTNAKDSYVVANWRFDDSGSSLGFYRYAGTNKLVDLTDPTTPVWMSTDDYTVNGALFKFVQDQWRFMGAYFTGEHHMDLPNQDTAGSLSATTKSRGFFGEFDVNFNERIGVFARVEKTQPDTQDETQDLTLKIAGLNGFLFRNAKCGGRWVLDAFQTDYNNGSPSDKALKLSAIVVF